jgi:hypothetical protein
MVPTFWRVRADDYQYFGETYSTLNWAMCYSEHLFTSTRLQGVTTQKTTMGIFSTVATSQLKQLFAAVYTKRQNFSGHGNKISGSINGKSFLSSWATASFGSYTYVRRKHSLYSWSPSFSWLLTSTIWTNKYVNNGLSQSVTSSASHQVSVT